MGPIQRSRVWCCATPTLQRRPLPSRDSQGSKPARQSLFKFNQDKLANCILQSGGFSGAQVVPLKSWSNPHVSLPHFFPRDSRPVPRAYAPIIMAFETGIVHLGTRLRCHCSIDFPRNVAGIQDPEKVSLIRPADRVPGVVEQEIAYFLSFVLPFWSFQSTFYFFFFCLHTASCCIFFIFA
jgi:hypothetical protein